MKNRPALRILFSVIVAASVFSIFQFIDGSVANAQPQSIEEAVQRLARKAAALPHERRVSLIWSNHEAVSVQRAEELKGLFVAHLDAAQIHVTQGETAPALRVSIEMTPSRIVITALVPGEGATSIAMEEIARSAVENNDRQTDGIRLEKELIWQSPAKMLGAALPRSTNGESKRMMVLGEDTIQIFREEEAHWKLLMSKAVPGARLAQRGVRGQLLLTEENAQQVGLLLPGRRCEANFADASPMVCTAVNVEWPSGRLLASPACGAQTWWLKSDATDWTAEDRLLLRNSAAGRDTAPVAELAVPGPVQSISAGAEMSSASVVVRNLLTGNYEVYRVALSCGN